MVNISIARWGVRLLPLVAFAACGGGSDGDLFGDVSGGGAGAAAQTGGSAGTTTFLGGGGAGAAGAGTAGGTAGIGGGGTSGANAAGGTGGAGMGTAGGGSAGAAATGGGTGGIAGNAATGGTAGSAATGGTAGGAAGKGGTAGTAGNAATGGTAGKGGTAGAAGTGGAAGAAGSAATGGTAGSAATGGTAGKGGTAGAAGSPTACGNGVIDPGEECDDANAINSDRCTNGCKVMCSSGEGKLGTHCYWQSTSTYAWSEGKTFCESIPGGHLVTITTQAEADFVFQHMTDATWIGYTDSVAEGTFAWVTGEPTDEAFASTMWANGEPNNAGGNEDCTEFRYSNEEWADAVCSKMRLIWCEVEPAGKQP